MSKRRKREKIEYYGEKLYLQEIARKEDLVETTLRKYYNQSGDIYKAIEHCKQISRPKKRQVVKIEYNGQMLKLYEIAEIEKIPDSSLRTSYLKLGDIYEAVESCKENARLEIEYYGEKLYLQEIARREDLVASTLRKCYRQSNDIYEAVEQCKQISRPEGYIVRIEYNGEMLTIHAIAEMEEISKISLKRSYQELGDIYEAVKKCKENARGEIERIEYKNQKLSIEEISKIEGVSANSLGKNYRLIGDIYEAIKITKQHLRKKIEYNGEYLTISAIAQREGISSSRLSRIYSIIGNIYEAVRISKSNSNVRREQIEQIEYYGEKMTVAQIAEKETLDVGTLNRYYKKTGNIYDAVFQCLEYIKRKVKKIEYENGEMLSIREIAKRENVGESDLRNHYNEIGNIFEAVRICKEEKAARMKRKEEKKQAEESLEKARREKNISDLPLSEIAKMEQLDVKKLKRCFDDTQNKSKAIFMAKYQQRKCQVENIKGSTVNLYDMSLLVGVKHRDLINLLNAGLSIDEIKGKYANQEAGEKITLKSGQTLLEFCVERNLNFAFIYRAIHTFGRKLSEAIQEHQEPVSGIPMIWIIEKYDVKIRELGITGLQSTLVKSFIQSELLSLDEALEKFVVRKNARANQLSLEWAEALYSLIKSREILGDDFQSDICLDENEMAFLAQSEAEILELKRKMQQSESPIIKKDISAKHQRGMTHD